jgi:small nuclear ribonucleoprotein (snRNP)-like protein
MYYDAEMPLLQLMFSVLKTLTGQEVIVELKNDLSIKGTLKSVDPCVAQG